MNIKAVILHTILVIFCIFLLIFFYAKTKVEVTSDISNPSVPLTKEETTYLIDKVFFDPSDRIYTEMDINGTNEYTVKVVNNNDIEVVVECLGSLNTGLEEGEPYWTCYAPDFNNLNRISLKPLETGNFNVYIDTNRNLKPGLYKIEIVFEAGIKGEYETRFETKRKSIALTINVTEENMGKSENADDAFCKINPDFCFCPFSCNSYKYCNDKVVVICKNCTDNDEALLEKTFEYQNTIYNCLQSYFGVNLQYPPIRYRLSYEKNPPGEGSYVLTSGVAGACDILNNGFFGYIYGTEHRVANISNLRADIHEATHIFTNSIFTGESPDWFREAISIYAESRLKCHPKQRENDLYMGDQTYDYIYLPLKTKNMSNFNSLGFVIGEAHYIGNLFDTGLEREYNCDVNCMFEIVRRLRDYCSAFERCDIDDKLIKSKAEEVTRKDLDPLFDLLGISYT